MTVDVPYRCEVIVFFSGANGDRTRDFRRDRPEIERKSLAMPHAYEGARRVSGKVSGHLSGESGSTHRCVWVRQHARDVGCAPRYGPLEGRLTSTRGRRITRRAGPGRGGGA